MIRVLRKMLGVAMIVALIPSAGAFALLGPFKGPASGFSGEPWQDIPYLGRPQGLGYQFGTDIGGPMLAHEFYRWNVPIVTYAFDASFVRYFGPRGMQAIEEAIAILNALPPASRMSETLDEYPMDVKSQNSEAAALGLLDLKSFALTMILEEMGLASPERFVFGLRGLNPTPIPQTFIYSVIQMNYDPVTIQPSRYVNGVLYNFQVVDPIGPPGGEWASAIEWFTLDPLRVPYSSVAGLGGSGDLVFGEVPGSDGSFLQALLLGQYISGLTRDDVGGLRYLLSTNNWAYEDLLPTVLPASITQAGSPWNPIFGTNLLSATNIAITNIVGTNILAGFVATGLRPGVDKLTFQRVNFDSLIGSTFSPITNRYTDSYINVTNGRIVRQKVSRIILRPDIIFAAGDIGTVGGVIPFAGQRTIVAGWDNNAQLNSTAQQFALGLGGPGVIVPGIEISFNDLFPYYLSLRGGTDADAGVPTTWGSFDGSDTPPVVYPIFQHPISPELSLDYLRALFTRPQN